MTKYIPIAPQTTAGKSWNAPADISIFANRGLLPLNLTEVGTASGAMPIALARSKESWHLVAICGQRVDHNLFIKSGKWLGNYLPEHARLYPFDVVAKDGKAIVTMDEESGTLRDDNEGKPFFNTDGKPEGEFEQVMALLMKRAAMDVQLQAMASSLNDAKVLMPWPEALRNSSGIDIPGLYMVNEKALNELDDEAFLKLRKSLALVYSINFSLSQQHILQRLAKLNPPAMAVEQVAEVFGDVDDTLKFNF